MSEDRRARWVTALQASRSDGWRSIEDLLDTPGFREQLVEEFPTWGSAREMSRRRFMQLLGASLALAGFGACTSRPREPILPYVKTAPETEPGRAMWYATAMTLGGYGIGLLVESHEGRPTKIEGNPDHPASLGAAGIYEQASLLELYDPRRARRLRRDREYEDWSTFVHRFSPSQLRPRIGVRGAGLHLLLEPTASPVVRFLLTNLREIYPEATVHFYAPLELPRVSKAASHAFGTPLHPLYDFRQAKVVLALDGDFLAAGPYQLRYARHFAECRRPESPGSQMNRLYMVEPVLTVTGASADHRLRVRAAEVESVLGAVTAEVVLRFGHRPPGMPVGLQSVLERYRDQDSRKEWTAAVAQDLAGVPGHSIGLAGESHDFRVHLLAHLLNAALGNVGTTVNYVRNPRMGDDASASNLGDLVEAMRSGAVETLIMLDTNPVYASAADLEFTAALRHVPETVCLGRFHDETGRAARWFIPGAHYLESWGDARAYDGTASVVQPLIAPLYAGKTLAEVLAVLAGDGTRSAHELVRDRWRAAVAPGDFEWFWSDAVQRGIVPGTAATPVRPELRWDTISAGLAPPSNSPSPGLEIVFQRCPKVYDGRFSNNAWLQELPDPMTKLTWSNAAMVSPATAALLGIDSGDGLRLRHHGREVSAPALVLPGMADGVVGLRLGYGHDAGGETLAAGVGTNGYALWTSEEPYYGSGLTVEPVASGVQLATTQTHWSLEGRPIALHATLAQYRRDPEFARRQKGRSLSLYQEPALASGDQWAMTIDLTTCTGCSACVVACQAENNVPVVGREGVLNSREMHWLRIDRYFVGGVTDPQVVPQPMLCQHCEKAPCEYVCPVNATVHSPDGLNEMIYNRCVGTRFCSNNCPYKVRRFNWFDYNAELAETERMAKNPDVTVRGRGVMEKCTFCVQRIRRAQIGANLERRDLRDGEVRTACQQACPTRAIVFGSLADRDAEVGRRREEPRSYAVLHELGTEPRIHYLARITNPNPVLDKSPHDA